MQTKAKTFIVAVAHPFKHEYPHPPGVKEITEKLVAIDAFNGKPKPLPAATTDAYFAKQAFGEIAKAKGLNIKQANIFLFEVTVFDVIKMKGNFIVVVGAVTKETYNAAHQALEDFWINLSDDGIDFSNYESAWIKHRHHLYHPKYTFLQEEKHFGRPWLKAAMNYRIYPWGKAYRDVIINNQL